MMGFGMSTLTHFPLPQPHFQDLARLHPQPPSLRRVAGPGQQSSGSGAHPTKQPFQMPGPAWLWLLLHSTVCWGPRRDRLPSSQRPSSGNTSTQEEAVSPRPNPAQTGSEKGEDPSVDGIQDPSTGPAPQQGIKVLDRL